MTKKQQPQLPPPSSQQAWEESLRRMDQRTASGISPTAVLTPNGTYREVHSADDAFFARCGWFTP